MTDSHCDSVYIPHFILTQNCLIVDTEPIVVLRAELLLDGEKEISITRQLHHSRENVARSRKRAVIQIPVRFVLKLYILFLSFKCKPDMIVPCHNQLTNFNGL